MKKILFLALTGAVSTSVFAADPAAPTVQCSAPIHFVIDQIAFLQPFHTDGKGTNFTGYNLKRSADDDHYPQFADSMYIPSGVTGFNYKTYSKGNHKNYAQYVKQLGETQATNAFFYEDFLSCEKSDTHENVLIARNSLNRQSQFKYTVGGVAYGFRMNVKAYKPEDPSYPLKCPNTDDVQYGNPVQLQLQTFRQPYSSKDDDLDPKDIINSQNYYVCFAKNVEENKGQKKCTPAKTDFPYAMKLAFSSATNASLTTLSSPRPAPKNSCVTMAE